MNANTRSKQFLGQIVDAPGVSGILILLARNRWLLPEPLRMRLKFKLRVHQALVSAPLPDGAVVKLWHDSSSSDVTTRIYWDGFAGYENGTPHFFLNRWGNSVTSLCELVPMQSLKPDTQYRCPNFCFSIHRNNSGGVFRKCRVKY